MRNRKTLRRIIAEAADGQEVTLRGWVKSIRQQKAFAFVMLNDGSQQVDLQVIINADTEAFKIISDVTTGSAVAFSGVVKESPGKGQKWEVHAKDLKIFGGADAETYPLQKKGHSLEFLREIGHLRPRTNTFGAMFRVRNQLAQIIHEFFQNNEFHWIHTPIITANDCEGAGELFHVSTLDHVELGKPNPDYTKDFFGKRSHLTVSGQLEVEAFALSMARVYTFGPTFRAENSNTSRHLAEFWMVEPEIAFADLNDDIQLAEDLLRYVFKHICERCVDDLMFFEKMYKNTSVEQLQQLSQSDFKKITYTDAVQELMKAKVKFEFPVAWGTDLQSEHERYLTDEIFKGPVTVTDYPKQIKAFYMRSNDDGKTVAAMDVLIPRIGELIGGSQREERLDFLTARMAEQKIPADELYWYLDLRRFGSTPHAGFGLGFERLLQYVTGMQNIRDVVPFPRAPGLISF